VNALTAARTAATRHKVVKGHVARARADHACNISRRNRVYPTAAINARPFNPKAARAEGRTLTKGYRKGVKTVRKARRKAR
jgi:hypothetical protein